MIRSSVSLLFVLALLSAVAAPALPPPGESCDVFVRYPDAGPTPLHQTGYAYPNEYFGGCADLDDWKSYSITSVSGPGNLNASIYDYSGTVTYNADTCGTYTVSIEYTWWCSCDSTTGGSVLTVTIC